MARSATKSSRKSSTSRRRSSGTSSKKRASTSTSTSRAQTAAENIQREATGYARQAQNAWSSWLQQTPFKMDNFAGSNAFASSMPSFPQFDQMKSKSQDAANQYNAFLNKATQAAEKSRNRLAAGAEECSKTIASMTQSNMQRANEALRSLMACKSLNEYADVQNRLFKQNFEAMSSETAKLVEQVTKTVASASEPLNDLAASAMNEAKKSMAA